MMMLSKGNGPVVRPRFALRVSHTFFAALLAAVMGAVNLLSGAVPALHARLTVLRDLLPLEVRWGSRLAATLAGFALLILAQHLARRKRAAWLIALVVLGVSTVVHLAKGLDWEEACLSLGLMAYLWAQRRHFFARSDAPTLRRGLRVAAIAFLFTLCYGIAGFYLLDRHFALHFGLADAAGQTLALFTEFASAPPTPTTLYGRWFNGSLYLVGAGTGGYALLCLLWPVLHRRPATDAERRRATAIVEQYGRSSVARFVLFDDKGYWFSPGGSVVGFAVAARTCVALGDVIGPDDDRLSAIAGFRDWCAEHDWQPAFYQTLPDYLDDYRAAGFSSLCVGHEAIVDVSNYTLAGGANKSLRTHTNRLLKAGHTTALLDAPLPDAVLEELRLVSDEWLSAQHGMGGEKRFSLGWFDDQYLRDSPVLVVRTSDGTIDAFANIIPEYQLNESTIDLMRRRSSAANGTMDLLFVSLFQWAKDQGFTTFNLGLSPLAGVGVSPDAPAPERAARFLSEHLGRFYHFNGLNAYKEKFHPTWSPRYLLYVGGPPGLAQAALAVIHADNAAHPLLAAFA